MRSTSALSIIFILSFFTACKKQDQCPEPPKKDSACDLIQSTQFRDSLSGDAPGLFSEYRKEYDNSGKVRKVVAGEYALSLVDSLAMLLTYDGSTVYFLDEMHPGDTILTATFDSQNRLQKMTRGNVASPIFETTAFAYESGQLSGYLISDLFQYHITYDGSGNVIRIYSDNNTESEGLFFTYDYTVKAKRQWYTDYFPENGASISVYLAQFLGWLPDLEPVNKRIEWKDVYTEDDDESTPPYVFERTLTNHVYDSNGNLVSYKNADAVYTSTWSCNASKNSLPN